MCPFGGAGQELTAGIDALVEHTRSPETFRSCLNNPTQLNVLVNAIGAFVAVDTGFQLGAQKLGRILESILEQEDTEQRGFLSALCAAHNLTPLMDDEGVIRTGRPGLVYALFGAYPDLWRRSGKDTLAGKRFNYYLAQARKADSYRSREDIRELEPLRLTAPQPGAPDGSAFRQMWSAADDEQRILLLQIAERAKLPVKRWRREWEVLEESKRRRRDGGAAMPPAVRAALFPQVSHVRLEVRAQKMHQVPVTVWFTGYSGSGKSTLAYELESWLLESGHACVVLDGDTTRKILSPDLGFTAPDRAENIRRIAAVARLNNDAGLIVITSLISPYARDREMARGIIGDKRFLEIHLSADVSICERRDPKGLYARARRGQVPNFTGVSAPYEAPVDAALVLDTANCSIKQCVQAVMELLSPRLRPIDSQGVAPSD